MLDDCLCIAMVETGNESWLENYMSSHSGGKLRPSRGWKSRFKQELTTWFQFRTDSNDERVAKIQSIVSPTDAVC